MYNSNQTSVLTWTKLPWHLLLRLLDFIALLLLDQIFVCCWIFNKTNCNRGVSLNDIVSSFQSMDQKHIAGYTGYVPGEKWKFGSRSGSEPPPLNRLAIPQGPPQERPVSRRISKSAKMRTFESEVVRGADSSTQFPVQTHEMAIQADVENNMHEEVRNIPPVTEGRKSRPSTRNGQPPLDGRTVNSNNAAAAHALFMDNDPFKEVYNRSYGRNRGGRFYDRQQENNNMALSKSMSDSIPAAGYSGHIPGLNTSVGKPYGVVIRELKGQSS